MPNAIEILKVDKYHNWTLLVRYGEGIYTAVILRDLHVSIVEDTWENISIATLIDLINSEEATYLLDDYINDNPNCPFIARDTTITAAIDRINHNISKREVAQADTPEKIENWFLKFNEVYNDFHNFLRKMYDLMEERNLEYYFEYVLERKIHWPEIKDYIKDI